MATSKFSKSLCLFWHGIFSGKKYPVAFYTSSERKALAKEVAARSGAYASSGNSADASRFTRLFEYINAYISAKNADYGAALDERDMLPEFLSLLYSGEKPAAFWKKFRMNHNLPIRTSPSAFWDFFEEFQPSRLHISPWLKKHARGKILDIGSGSHSYINADVAADISRDALAKNTFAKKKVVLAKKYSRLPFPPATFGTVMLNSVLAYVKNDVKMLAECKRVLAPGGVLLISNAPVADHHPAKYFQIREVDADGLSRTLAKLGFEVLDESIGKEMRLAFRAPPQWLK